MDLLSKLAFEQLEPTIRDEWINLVCNEVDSLKKKYIRKYLDQQLRDHTLGGKLQEVYDLANPIKVNAQFVTLNFTEKYKPEETLSIIENIKQLKWVKDIRFALEQRSETQMWYGFHIHMLITTKKPKSEIIRELYKLKCISKYLGSKQSIDVRKITGQDSYNKSLNYITGKKSDPDKHAKQVQDIIMNKYYNITCDEEQGSLCSEEQ